MLFVVEVVLHENIFVGFGFALLVFGSLLKFPGVIEVLRNQETRRIGSDFYNMRFVLLDVDVDTSQFDYIVLQVVGRNLESKFVLSPFFIMKE